jgi:hypothetical protein
MHSAHRYARTKQVLARFTVAAGATVVGLGVLTAPGQATTTHLTGGTTVAGVATPAVTTASAVSAGARITNSAGNVKPKVQAAANAIVANVPGAARITIGGTRASAVDPKGHPSGRALDYIVRSDAALGDAIALYHIAHWHELGVEYVIWQQKILTSPSGGPWKHMKDRGSATANHRDHVHVNYRA